MKHLSHRSACRYAATALCLMLLQVTMTRTGYAAVDRTAPDAIRAAAESAVLTAGKRIGAALQASAAALDPRLQLHACGGPLQAFVAGDGQLREFTTVAVRCEAPVRWTIYVRVAVSSEQLVLTARRPMARDSTLSGADFETSRRSMPGLGSRYISDAAALAGRKLRRPLAAGEAVTADALVIAPVILRGQQLTLIARTGAMEVRVAAVAMADGRPDERIAVRNIATQRVVEAVIRSNGLAEVSL